MRRLTGHAVSLCLVVACGCGDSSEPPVPLYPVSGKVTRKGKPVVDADVTFFNETANRSAFGRTGEDGEFQMTTFTANDGAVEGPSVVTVTKMELSAAPTTVAPLESTAYIPPGANQSTDPVKPKSSLPEKYGSPTTSGLTADVKPEGPNRFEFDLKD